MNNSLRLALTLTALSLLPFACTIETKDDDATGGTGNTGVGGSVNNGGAANKGGTTSGTTAAKGGATTGGSNAAAGNAAVAGASANAGAAATTGGAPGAAGATSVAGSTGTSVNVAGSAGASTTAAAGAPATGGAGVTGGTTGVAGGANVAGAAGAPAAIVRTRVNVTDDITAPTTWTADHIYVVSGVNFVSATLTIQPGTIIKFAANGQLRFTVDGQLNAPGTADAHIVFTSLKDDSAGGDTNGDAGGSVPNLGDWDYVSVASSSSNFDYIEFRYSEDGLQLDGAGQSVKHSTFTYNTSGLDATGATPTNTVITGNTFYSNVHPIGVTGGLAVDNTNIFHNPAVLTQLNTFQSIDIVDVDIANTVTWSNTEVAYSILSGQLFVNSPAALTLAPNVVVKLGAGVSLRVQSGATLNGVATAFFTSYKDDSKLGDANGDGAASTPAAEDWGYIGVNGAELNGANITYNTPE